jgi:hypothetical protein
MRTSHTSIILPLTLVSTPTFAATLLTLEGLPHNTTIPATFADFASADSTGLVVSAGIDGFVGTPNVDIGWSGIGHVLDSYQNWDGRGGVLQTDFNGTGGTQTIDIPFIPASSSFGILITSFELDLYTGGGPAQVDWSILAGATTIASNTWTRATGGRDLIMTGITAAQARSFAGETITLRLLKSSGLGSYFAVDNLAFDQVVPEPSVATAAMMGLGAMAMRRRRAVA